MDFIKSPEWQTKRQQVFDRDGHKCRFCGCKPSKGNELQCDHGSYVSRSLPYEEALQAFKDQSIHDTAMYEFMDVGLMPDRRESSLAFHPFTRITCISLSASRRLYSSGFMPCRFLVVRTGNRVS